MKRTHGFTLVELLVALAVTSVLVVLLVNVVAATLNVWTQSRNQIDTFANARETLGRIADEIKGAVASGAPLQIEFSENIVGGAFTTGGPSPTPNPQPTPQPTKSENVFFVAPYPNSGAGDLCVIAYRHIDIDQTSPSENSHTLQRAFVDSQNAWNASPAARYTDAGYAALDWRTVSKGVLEFEIQSYSQQDIDAAPPTPTPTPSWDSITTGTVMTGNTPRRVVIRIKVVDDRTLVKLNSLPFGSTPYNRLVNTFAREFTADVVLPPPH